MNSKFNDEQPLPKVEATATEEIQKGQINLSDQLNERRQI